MTPYIGDGPSGAVFSPCRQYRYSLWRRWEADCEPSRMCAFIGLNPSTADETLDDPTIRRCIRFCKDWGFGGYVMLNLFAFRATDPKVMKAAKEPIGADNDYAILRVVLSAGQTVCAWGNHGTFKGRAENRVNNLRDNGRKLYHLGLTKTGQPSHPLYKRADTKPILWT